MFDVPVSNGDARVGEIGRQLAPAGPGLRGKVAGTEYISRRAGRTGPFRHLWWALRRRDFDAAGSRRRAGLRRGTPRPRLSGPTRLLPRLLCRTAEPALFRR